MEIDVWYFVIGALLTVLGTWMGIWYSNKLKAKIQISLIDQNWMSIIDTFEDNFNVLKLQNYQLPVNNNLYYYQGVIINTGNIDIDKLIIHKPLKIILPNDLKIIELRTNDKSKDIGLEIFKDENTISIHWELMKLYEYFEFEILIEGSVPYNWKTFHQNLKIDHRISGLRRINRVDSRSVQNMQKNAPFFSNVGSYIMILVMLTVFSSGGYLGIKSFFTPEVKIKYQNFLKETNSPVEIAPFSKDSVLIISNGIQKRDAYDNIHKTIISIPTAEMKSNKYFLAILGASISLLFLFLLITLVRDDVKDYRMLKIIKSIK